MSGIFGIFHYSGLASIGRSDIEQIRGRLMTLGYEMKTMFCDERVAREIDGQSLHDYLSLWTIPDISPHIDPVGEADNLVVVVAEPVFVGSVEEGYRRAEPNEWVLELQAKGLKFFQEIVNNVSAAVLEKTGKNARLHLISHRLGPGRMYYRFLEDGIVFSSDVRVLAKVAPAKPNPMGLWSIIAWGSVPEPLSVLDGIFAVPVGQAVTFELGSTIPVYTQILQLDFKSDNMLSEKDCLAEAGKAIHAGSKLVAELGASMTVSGGIDSSLFLCMMQKAVKQRKHGYVCSFGEDDPEIAYARQIAEATDTDLKIFELSDDLALSAIRYAAESSVHPFSDFSAVPVAFLLKHIAEDRPDCPWIFDGNGGDDCFGVAGQEMLGRWQYLCRLPRVFHKLASDLWLHAGFWKNYSALDIVLRKLFQAGEPDAYLAPFVYGNFDMTCANPAWSVEVRELLLASFNACTGNRGDNHIYANFYVAQLLHVCSRLWTAKSLGPAHDLGKTMLYPFLWRDVLNSMGKIPWNLKVRNGVAKWPLKKMLEKFMTEDFISRPKSGFVPPWRRWLQNEKINRFTRESLLGGTGYITTVLKEEWIERMLKHLKETDSNPPTMILNTLWGALSTELWLQKRLR